MKKNAAIVFISDPDTIDIVLEELQQDTRIDLVYCKTSYSKLLVVQEPEPEEEPV
jgi:hypothetical protein